MRDPVTFDQLKIFIACVERGSFSGAARKLHRTQSVVSQAIAQLERQIGVTLFDRSGRLPTLTDEGRALLADARIVARGVDGFKARAKSLSDGLEPELSVAMDALFPMEWLTQAVDAFRHEFPGTPLRLHVDAMGAILQPVLDGQCRIAVIGSLPDVPDTLESQPLLDVAAVTVVAPTHPLASHDGPIPRAVIEQHVQLVLTDRSRMTDGRDYGVVSPITWRLADLSTKHAFLRAGFGWGHMPRPQVEADLAQGSLVTLEVEGLPFTPPSFAMRSVHRKDAPPGPAARWFLDWLKQAEADRA
jgi:DNA-binding transcriptional LysR family regulator